MKIVCITSCLFVFGGLVSMGGRLFFGGIGMDYNF